MRMHMHMNMQVQIELRNDPKTNKTLQVIVIVPVMVIVPQMLLAFLFFLPLVFLFCSNPCLSFCLSVFLSFFLALHTHHQSQVVSSLLEEMASLFPDEYFHIGTDEVRGVWCGCAFVPLTLLDSMCWYVLDLVVRILLVHAYACAHAHICICAYMRNP